MIRPLIRSPAFVRTARRAIKKEPRIAENIRDALKLLAADAFDARLRTHKLKGNLEGLLACSAGYDLRIVFQLVEHEGAEAILLESVGTHDEIY